MTNPSTDDPNSRAWQRQGGLAALDIQGRKPSRVFPCCRPVASSDGNQTREPKTRTPPLDFEDRWGEGVHGTPGCARRKECNDAMPESNTGGDTLNRFEVATFENFAV